MFFSIKDFFRGFLVPEFEDFATDFDIFFLEPTRLREGKLCLGLEGMFSY